MRCPDCGSLMHVSFITDPEPKYRVWQCSTAGVPQYTVLKSGRYKRTGSTTDHTDLYFTQERPGGPLLKVKPVDLGTAKRRALGGGTETYHRWGLMPVLKVVENVGDF